MAHQIDGRFLSVDTQIESIQKILSNSQVNQRQIQEALVQLDQLTKFLSESRAYEEGWQDHLELKQEEVKNLSQRLRDLSIDNEINLLTEESGQKAQKMRIEALIQNHALSPDQRRKIRAHMSASGPEMDVRSKTQDVVFTSLSYQQVENLAPKSRVVPLFAATEAELSLEERHDIAIELFEAAEKLWDGDVKSFFSSYNQLLPQIKRQLMEFFSQTGADIAKMHEKTNLINTIRSLIAVAHEITDSYVLEPIPSEEDVKQIFEDLAVIKEQGQTFFHDEERSSND